MQGNTAARIYSLTERWRKLALFNYSRLMRVFACAHTRTESHTRTEWCIYLRWIVSLFSNRNVRMNADESLAKIRLLRNCSRSDCYVYLTESPALVFDFLSQRVTQCRSADSAMRIDSICLQSIKLEAI